MLTLAESRDCDAIESRDILATHVAQLGSPMLYVRNTEVRSADSCNRVFRVVSGAVRICKSLLDGRRHIGAFYLAGDFFGLEKPSVGGMSFETTCNSTIAAVDRSSLLSEALLDTDLARALWRTTALELRRSQRHMMLLVQSAQERVASFLLEIAARQGDCDQIDLPMSRQDIADYLGLTIETVSRSITHLEERAIIQLNGTRRVKLKNLPALRKLDI